MIGNVFSNIVIALLVLGVIIVIHELGHFLVAELLQRVAQLVVIVAHDDRH